MLQLKLAKDVKNADDEEIQFARENSVGFLPNGDLILASLMDCKIYLYSFESRPKINQTLWDFSQTYNLEIPKSLNLNDEYIDCLIYQTKLFISTTTKFHEYDSATMISQWDLSTMTFEMQYNLSDSYKTITLDKILSNIVINENQTLLALNIKEVIYIFSMETGIQISRYSGTKFSSYTDYIFFFLKESIYLHFLLYL